MNIKSCAGIAFRLQNANLLIEIEDPITLDLTSKQFTGVTLIDCFKQVIEEVEKDDDK